MSDEQLPVALGLLFIAALALDAFIPAKRGKWGSGDASAQDVARIVAGDKPRATPRHGLKLGLLLVVVFAILVLFGGRL